jgi:hypothetical protein
MSHKAPKQETAHTPTPWRAVGEGSEAVIRGPKGPDGYGDLVCVMGAEPRGPLDRSVILRATNSHDALVAALREWQEVAAALEGEPIRFDLHRTIRGALEAGRAALALVEGGQNAGT